MVDKFDLDRMRLEIDEDVRLVSYRPNESISQEEITRLINSRKSRRKPNGKSDGAEDKDVS